MRWIACLWTGNRIVIWNEYYLTLVYFIRGFWYFLWPSLSLHWLLILHTRCQVMIRLNIIVILLLGHPNWLWVCGIHWIRESVELYRPRNVLEHFCFDESHTCLTLCGLIMIDRGNIRVAQRKRGYVEETMIIVKSSDKELWGQNSFKEGGL